MIEEQWSRPALLLGQAGIEALQASHVMVAGCGAVGSFALEALARCGVGTLTLIDNDNVEPSNINRQLCALHSTLGQKKTQVLAGRIADINPRALVKQKNLFIDKANVETLFEDTSVDFVVDAIDTVESKIAFIEALQKYGLPFVSSMGAARKTQPDAVRILPMKKTMYCPLAAKLRKRLKADNVALDFPCVCSMEPAQQEKVETLGSLVTVTGVFGLMAASEAIKYLLTRKTR
ncbi:MAG: tRNA threonylcarbamoyladenosine dehydratase [Alphaproteobacteria bacterium]|nr:tRNA threonylcarbamoyladenosine dehydratase [Alphaproteobacteria bacterium]